MNFDKFFISFTEYLRTNSFVIFSLSLDFTSILKAVAVLLLLHFDSCLAEAIIICLTKQMNTFFNQSFRDVLLNSLAEKCLNIPREISVVEPCFNKVTW